MVYDWMRAAFMKHENIRLEKNIKRKKEKSKNKKKKNVAKASRKRNRK